MSLTVRKFSAQVRDSTTGEMIPAGLLSSDALGAINTAKNTAVAAVQAQGATTIASIPSDYTSLSNEVDDLKSAIDALNNIYDYKGSVETSSALPASGNKNGDLYVVEDEGENYVWNDGEWVPVGNLFGLSDGSVTEEKLSEPLQKVINDVRIAPHVDMDAFRAMTLDAIASYLVHEVGSTCVVGTPENIEQKFVAKYSSQKSVQWAMANNSSYSFDYDDTQTDNGVTYPVLYSECNTALNLITRGIKYENSPYLYAFEHTADADENHIRYLFMENEGSNRQLPTIDFLNALTTYRNAQILDNGGSNVRKVGEKVNGVVTYDEDAFAEMETGDLIFIGGNSVFAYKKIHHCAYFIKNISDLDPYGAQYGVTFRYAQESVSGTGEHGYLFECGGSLNLNKDYIDVLRIRDVELSMSRTSDNDILYVAKPCSNALTSNRKLRAATGLYAWYDSVSQYNRFPSNEAQSVPAHGNVFINAFSKNYSLSANSTLWITREDMSYSAPDGYHSAGVVGLNTGDSGVVPIAWRNPDSNSAFIRLKNLENTTKNYTCTVTVLFISDNLAL